jgi:hypothetical protein
VGKGKAQLIDCVAAEDIAQGMNLGRLCLGRVVAVRIGIRIGMPVIEILRLTDLPEEGF